MGVRRRLTLAALLVSCAASLAAASGLFATATWLPAGAGNWDTAANWSTAAEPTALDDANVLNGGTAQITTAANQALLINIGTGGGTSGTVSVMGGSVQAGDFDIGSGSGTGTLRVDGGGQVTLLPGGGGFLFAGDNGSGTITVDGAGSHLNWTGGVIGIGAQAGGTGTLNLLDGGQLTGSSVGLAFQGGTGTINVGNGGAAGVLSADVTTLASPGPATLHFNHTGGVTFARDIAGAVAVTKSAAGNVTLTGANTYTGGTTINQGGLTGNSGSLPGNIVTSFGGNLTFNQTVDGTYAGVISGGGTFTKGGAGTLTMTGMNTYALTTFVQTGTLRAGAANVFPPALMLLTATGTFDLNGHNQTIGGLQGGGNVTLGSASLTFSGSGDTFSGIMSGSGTVTKSGSGLAIFSGNNTYTGATTVTGGTLLVNGSQPSSAVTLTGGTLGGTGTVGAITASGGTVAPGVSPGILSSGNVSFNSATTFAAELDGAAAGSGHDQLNVTGTVALGSAALTVTRSFTPAAGTAFVIINNDGADAVTGTFNGHAEGSVFDVGGQSFQVRYTGGDGNDVTLRAVTAPVIGPATLPAMTVGAPFTVTFTATGGAPPYTFSVSAGTLPAGLALSASGTLSGTPTTAGPFSFTIMATDSLGVTDVQAYSGDVLPPPVPSLPMWGFIGLAGLLAGLGWLRVRSGAPFA